MGGSPSMPSPQPLPPAPQPIDYNKMANASIRVAKAQSAEQEAMIKRLYPEYTKLQFKTADQLAGKLDNDALRQARGIAQQELKSDMGPSALEKQFKALGASAMSYRPDQVRAPTDIREVRGISAQRSADISARQVGSGALGQSLMSEARRRVNSGGNLSSEATRDAVQSARAGMASRGMAMGNAGAAAELLNRDRYARQRNMEDLGFAQGVQNFDVQRQFQNASAELEAARSNQMSSNQMSLADQAAMMDAQRLNAVRDTSLAQFNMNAQLANQGANMTQTNNNRAFLGQVSQQAFLNDAARSQRRLGIGAMMMDMDPYRQALGPAFQMGANTLGNTTNQVNSIFGGSLAQAGNVASFNTNMQASQYNSALNNNAALQGAYMQAGAAGQAGMMGMIGSGVGAAAGIGGGLLLL